MTDTDRSEAGNSGNAIPASVMSDAPHCNKCEAPMTLLGRLPSKLHHGPIAVYRCYRCNEVRSEKI